MLSILPVIYQYPTRGTDVYTDRHVHILRHTLASALATGEQFKI